MKTLLLEAKKVYIHKHGLLFVGLYLLMCIFSLVVFDKPGDTALESNREQYGAYMDEFQGKCTAEKEQAIADEYQRLDSAKAKLQTLYDGYYNGNIPKAEFERESAILTSAIANSKGFDLLYSQYIYVRENPENRFFVYTNGWDGLLASDNLDIFLVLLILLLVTPIFVYEQESSMGALLVTVRRGGAYQSVCKIILALASAILLCVLSFGIRYGFYAIKYGLPCADYPLQSLSFFAASLKNITLSGAFAIISALKIAGYVSFASIILAVSQLAKKYAITVFSCMALILLPYVGFGTAYTKYYLPFPLGFMTGTGFLRGSEYAKDFLTDEKIAIFKEVPLETLAILLSFMLFISIVLIAVTVLRSRNKWSGGQGKPIFGIAYTILFLCFVPVALSGCSVDASHYDVFNHSTRMTYENEQYKIFVDESDLNNRRIVFEDKETGAIRDLVRDPFGTSVNVELAVYGNGSYVYYAIIGIDNSKLKPISDRISVVEVNLDNFSEQVIFENNINPKRDSFLGLLDNNHDGKNFPPAVSYLFVDDEYVYLESGDGIRQINRTTHAVKMLNVPTNRSVAYGHGRIWYINDKSEVMAYDPQNEREHRISDIITTCFYLTDDELLYLNRLDKSGLYSLNLTTDEKKKISDREIQYFYCDRQYIYFLEKGSYTQFCMEWDGRNCVAVVSERWLGVIFHEKGTV
jgi:hypothetical protein